MTKNIIINKFVNAVIYKLANSIDTELYIGSTCDVAARKSCHMSSSKRRTSTVYKHLNAVGWANVNLIIIEQYPCGNKAELLSRERYWIEKLNPTLNSNLPIATKEENRQRALAYHQTDAHRATQRAYSQTPAAKAYQKEFSKSDVSKAYQKSYHTAYYQARKKQVLKQHYGNMVSILDDLLATYNSIQPINFEQ